MIKKSLLFGAIASVIAINSVFADTIVTSQSYVDNHDALKQDKITAGTTGNVVTYNGTQNGQAQFSERAIYDGSNDYNETTDANKLITAGAVNTMAPELPTGEPNYVVTYDNSGNIGGELEINDISFFGSDGGSFADNNPDALVKVSNLSESMVYDLQSNWSSGRDIPSAGAVVEYAQPKKTCAGWADGTTTPDATHTNANCVLWNLP